MKPNIISQATKDSFWNFLMTLFAKIGGLIFTVLLARFLLPEKFGIYNLAMSIAIVLWILADLGINESLIRYFSESLGKNNKKTAILRYKYLFRLKLFLTLFFSISLLLFSYPLSIFIFKKPDLFFPLLFSAIYLLVYSLESFYSVFFFILKNVKYLAFRQLLSESTRIVGVILVFLLLSKTYHVIGVIGALIFSTALATFYILFNLRRYMPLLFSNHLGETDKKDKKRINKFLIYSGIGSTLTMLFISIDVLMLGFFLPSEFIGFYSAAWSLIAGLSSFISIANILLPIFSQLKDNQVNQAFNKVFKYISLISIPAFFGMLLLGKYMVITIYGYDYLPASLPLYFLSLLIIELPLSNILKSIFSAREKPKYFVNILVFATIANIILNYLLITSFLKISMQWAMTGAAIATLLTRFFYVAGLAFFAKKELNINVNMRYFAKPLFSSLIMASVLFYINTKISNMTIFIGIVEVILGIFIYFSIMYLIKGIQKEDFLLIKELIS